VLPYDSACDISVVGSVDLVCGKILCSSECLTGCIADLGVPVRLFCSRATVACWATRLKAGERNSCCSLHFMLKSVSMHASGPTMASTVSSVPHHPFGTRHSRGAAAARCAPRDDTDRREPASQDMARPKCHSCSCLGRQITPNPTTYLQSTTTLLYSCHAGSRSYLSISRVSTGCTKPPASTRADYCPLRSYSNAD
jgi:hypothetical protein